MEPAPQAAPSVSPLVRRRVRLIRIAAAVSAVVLANYFLRFLLFQRAVPPVFLFAFLPLAFFSYRLVSKPAAQKIKNWLGLAAGVGLFTLLFCFFWMGTYAWQAGLLLLLMPAQLILMVGAEQADKALGRQPGDTLKFVGGLLSGIIYCAPFFVYTGAMMWAGDHGWRRSNERSATSTLRSLHQAQLSYAETYHRGFTDGLNRLGPSERPTPTYPRREYDAERADLVDERMAGLAEGGTNTGFTKVGYVFTYTPGRPNAEGRITTYTITARPLHYRKTGERSFFMDQSGVIRATAEDSAATAQDPPL